MIQPCPRCMGAVLAREDTCLNCGWSPPTADPLPLITPATRDNPLRCGDCWLPVDVLGQHPRCAECGYCVEATIHTWDRHPEFHAFQRSAPAVSIAGRR